MSGTRINAKQTRSNGPRDCVIVWFWASLARTRCLAALRATIKFNSLLALIGILVFLSGCMEMQVRQQKAREPLTSCTAKLKTTLRGLNLPDPGADLKLNISNGDYRFIGICGIACFAPGLNEAEYPLTLKYGVRALEGTSDAIESGEHATLMGEAGKYAEGYNKLLVHYLASKGAP